MNVSNLAFYNEKFHMVFNNIIFALTDIYETDAILMVDPSSDECIKLDAGTKLLDVLKDCADTIKLIPEDKTRVCAKYRFSTGGTTYRLRTSPMSKATFDKYRPEVISALAACAISCSAGVTDNTLIFNCYKDVAELFYKAIETIGDKKYQRRDVSKVHPLDEDRRGDFMSFMSKQFGF